MNRRLAFLLAGISVVALNTSVVRAAESAASSGVSSTTSGEASRSIVDDLYASFTSTYKGQAISDPGSPRTFKTDGQKDPKTAINLDSEIGAGYMFTKNVGAGFIAPFLATPVLGEGLTLGDVGIKAFDKKSISSGGLTVATSLAVQAPSSKYSRDRGMTFGVKTSPSVRYQFRNSRFAVGALTEAKAYIGAFRGKTFKAYGAPYASYRLNPSLSLMTKYEMEADHFAKKGGSFDLTNNQTDLQTGVVWDITPKVFVNPYLQFFTGNRIASDTTVLGAYLSASL